MSEETPESDENLDEKEGDGVELAKEKKSTFLCVAPLPLLQSHPIDSLISFINPDYGWDALNITEPSIRRLLFYLGVFSSFFKYLRGFGTKTYNKDEGFGGFDIKTTLDNDGTLQSLGNSSSSVLQELLLTKIPESVYLLKYVDLKDVPSTPASPAALPAGKFTNPYSIRQALIYHTFDLTANNETYIFIRLSELLGSRFRSLLSKSRAVTEGIQQPHWTEIQSLCFSSVVDNWREYINWIDEQVSILFDRVILAAVDPHKTDTYDSVTSSLRDMKRLQYLLDQALRTANMLDLNILTMARLSSSTQNRSSLSLSDDALYTILHEKLDSCISDHEFMKRNVLSLVARATILSNQLRDTVSFRNSEMNKETANLTARGTAAIVNISNKSSHEARVVKILTLIALIFVPTSFVADFLNMGYIHVSDSGFSVSATKGLIFYAILAIPLIFLTLAVYFLSELFNRRAARRQRDWRDEDEEVKI